MKGHIYDFSGILSSYNAGHDGVWPCSVMPGWVDRSHVFLEGVELELVPHFKYLGVITDSNLTFKKHIKKVSSTVKFSIQNFKHIRPFISTEAAKVYLHCMILSHLEYCSIVWSCTGSTAITPLEQLYKKAIKVFDKKPQSHHHCRVLEKYNLFSFENFQIFKRICLIYRSLHGLAPPPLGEFVKRRNSQLCTRADGSQFLTKKMKNRNFIIMTYYTHHNHINKYLIITIYSCSVS